MMTMWAIRLSFVVLIAGCAVLGVACHSATQFCLTVFCSILLWITFEKLVSLEDE